MSAPTVHEFSSQTPRFARFGDFELDLLTQELRRNGIRIRLQPKPFQVLQALLQRGNDIVTRSDLQRRLWPDNTFVEFETSLNTAVNRLRQALCDTAEDPKFVETLPRRGYRFLAPVHWIEAEETLPRILAAHNSGPGPSKPRRLLLLAGVLLLFAVVALMVWTVKKGGLRVTPKHVGMNVWKLWNTKQSGGRSPLPRSVSVYRLA